jgi:hypothetical protein
MELFLVGFIVGVGVGYIFCARAHLLAVVSALRGRRKSRAEVDVSERPERGSRKKPSK